MSPMKLASLISAAAATVALTFTCLLEAAASEPLVPEHVVGLLRLAALIAWIYVGLAHVRDSLREGQVRHATALMTAIDPLDPEIARQTTEAELAARLDAGTPTAINGRPHLVQR